jgi:predicted RND superfamily exporter protein
MPGLATLKANTHYGVAINEVLSVSGAIWGVVVSLALVIMFVVLFKASFNVTFIMSTMMLCNLGIVVGCFHAVGWVLGGVEAVCLSILVGTGCDYCIHMLEGFLETHPDHMEGKAKARLEKEMEDMDEKQQRDHRVKVNIKNVGVPVVSAAITTALCGFVLSFCKLCGSRF